MSDTDKIYRDLQIHLDQQTFGFPATQNGSDIELLKLLFNPEQAGIATNLTYRFEPVETIYERLDNSEVAIDELEKVLDEIAKRGSIGLKKEGEIKYYRNIPYVVGMYEWQNSRLSAEFLDISHNYTSDPAFGTSFISTKISQMRIIPIEESISPHHQISNYDEVKQIIENIDGPIVILECICRHAAEIRGATCEKTSRKETCMALRDDAELMLHSGLGRQINKEEALEILRKNQEDGLVLQPSNAQKPDFICSCCGCCCGILDMQKSLPRPVDFWSSNYYAEVDPEFCTGCETCVMKCQVNALHLDEEKGFTLVDLNRCIGCGNCVPSCPGEAIQLKKRDKETIPPKTDEDMFEIIMTNKA
jgi:ferredoxin